MKQSGKRLTSMLLSLTFFVGALLVFFELIQPAYGDLQKKKGMQLSNEDLLTQEQTVVTNAKALLDSYQKESQAEGNLSLAMPTGPNTAAALAQIYGIAQNNNVTLKTFGITLTPPVAKTAQNAQPANPNAATTLSAADIVKPLGNLAFTVQGTGSYESIKEFLIQLETNIRVFDVKTLAMQPVNATPGATGSTATPDSFQINVTITTYYQGQ